MTSIEKKMIVAVAVCIIGAVVVALYLSRQIENSGGVKQVIINVGKEVKDISREISKD